MRTCSRCHTQSADSVLICPSCQANMQEYSTTAIALSHFRENPRVKAIRIVAPEAACPICKNVTGIYAKDEVPVLPSLGCSEVNGCCSFYEPILEEIYP